jgi:leucyl/phenylalanyl-tRNA--protein transferase
MPIYLLSHNSAFPDPRQAAEEGLLAVGGDLSEERLLKAYSMGIFPWYSENEPILWWSPDPRLVLFPDNLRVSRSLQKLIKKGVFDLTVDTAFERVIGECARIPRKHEKGTWILAEMRKAYSRLHDSGFAHSVEAWQDGQLAGGLYGISLGKSFFGESMFARASNASKVAFVALVEYLKAFDFDMIDCQVTTGHLLNFGAREISRSRYLSILEKSLKSPTMRGKWSFENDI